jgi:DNA (cytosine-5)-methyltransferase 1
MNHGSLFSGIGGFDLAAEWMGWENIFHCEWNPFGQKVLKHHFPNSISYNDITKTEFTIHRGSIDILTGGFPCQPYSLAGKRKGKEDERHLWPEMLRAIREIQPRFVVGENVFGIINWNGGMVFNEVQTDLEAEGYEVWPYVLPACAVNAPHRRDRVWFVAYSIGSAKGSSRKGGGIKENECLDNSQSKQRGDETKQYSRPHEFSRDATNTNRNGLNRINCQHEINSSEGRFNALSNVEQMGGNNSDTEIKGLERLRREKERYSQLYRGQNRIETWQNFPTQSPICGGDDGLPTELDNITFSKWRNESIKGFGNAIVPQVAYQIFKAIEYFNKTKKGKEY